MRVGDLVRCPTTNGALGMVVAITNRAVGAAVKVALIHNNTERCFQWQHLEVISAGR